MCYVIYMWHQAIYAMWPTCGDMQNVLSKIKCVLWTKCGVKQNVLFKTKCVLWPKCGVK